MQLLKPKLGFYLVLVTVSPLLVIGAFASINNITGVGKSPSVAKSTTWDNAFPILGAARFQDAFLTNFTRSDLLVKAQGRSVAWKFQVQGAPPMIAIDFRMPKLCGSLGCMYAIYTVGEKPKLISRFLLYPEVPDRQPIMSVKGDRLSIAQVGGDGKLVELSYRYDQPTSSFIYLSRQALATGKAN